MNKVYKKIVFLFYLLLFKSNKIHFDLEIFIKILKTIAAKF